MNTTSGRTSFSHLISMRDYMRRSLPVNKLHNALQCSYYKSDGVRSKPVFMYFEDFADYEQFLKSLPLQKRKLHEIVPDEQPVRFYLDCDAKADKHPSYAAGSFVHKNEFNLSLRVVCDKITNYIGQQMNAGYDITYSIYTAHRDNKLSAHVIFDAAAINKKDAKAVAKHAKTLYENDAEKFVCEAIDMAVYNRNGSLRLPHNVKDSDESELKRLVGNACICNTITICDELGRLQYHKQIIARKGNSNITDLLVEDRRLSALDRDVKPTGDLAEIAELLDIIPNDDLPMQKLKKIMWAVHYESNASEDGFIIFREHFLKKSKKFTYGITMENQWFRRRTDVCVNPITIKTLQKKANKELRRYEIEQSNAMLQLDNIPEVNTPLPSEAQDDAPEDVPEQENAAEPHPIYKLLAVEFGPDKMPTHEFNGNKLQAAIGLLQAYIDERTAATLMTQEFTDLRAELLKYINAYFYRVPSENKFLLWDANTVNDDDKKESKFTEITTLKSLESYLHSKMKYTIPRTNKKSQVIHMIEEYRAQNHNYACYYNPGTAKLKVANSCLTMINTAPNYGIDIYADHTPFLPDSVQRYFTEIFAESKHLREYVIQWLARCVLPNARNSTALVLSSFAKGTGKSALSYMLNYILGNNRHVMNTIEPLAKNFNKYMKSKLITIEEYDPENRGFRTAAMKLKELITGEQIEIEGKGVDSTMMKNYSNWLLITNEDYLPTDSSETRRFCAVRMPMALYRNSEFFIQFKKDIREHGGNIFAWLKQQYNEDYDMTRVPQTEMLQDNARYNLSTVQKYIISLLDSDAIKDVYTVAEFYKHYNEFCKSEFGTESTKQFMSKQLRKIAGITVKQGYINGVKARRAFMDVQALRVEFCDYIEGGEDEF